VGPVKKGQRARCTRHLRAQRPESLRVEAEPMATPMGVDPKGGSIEGAAVTCGATTGPRPIAPESQGKPSSQKGPLP
jgi:hypothetical protein